MKRLALAALLAVAAGCGSADAPITPAIKRQHLTFDPSVAPQDRQWIEEALAQARPEAKQLVDDVDGMVTIKTWYGPNDMAVGLTQPTGKASYTVSFNLSYLDGPRKIDRPTVALHEFGHVIDFGLMPDGMDRTLADELPTTGSCITAETGDCSAPEERFADTFAKWALRGAVSAVGSGYSLATPASLEDWGAPLSQLAVEIDVELTS
jgi:hypothetical protein